MKTSGYQWENETVGEWQARLKVEEAAAELAAQQAQQAEKIRQQAAQVPQSERETNLQLAQEYFQKLEEASNQKTASQRALDKLQAEREQLDLQMIELIKNPTKNAQAINDLAPKQQALHAREEQLEKDLMPPENVLWDGNRYAGGTRQNYDTAHMAKEMQEYRNRGE